MLVLLDLELCPLADHLNGWSRNLIASRVGNYYMHVIECLGGSQVDQPEFNTNYL